MTKTKIVIPTSMGEMTLRQIADHTGIDYLTIRNRYYRGERGDALLEPLKKTTLIPFRGKLMTAREISDETGIPAFDIYNRYKRCGLTDDSLVKPVLHKNPQDYIGKKYGKLTIKSISKRGNTLFAICVCDCGNVIEKRLYNITTKVKNQYLISCGCGRSHIITHGMSKTKEHKAWRHIKERCLNKNSKSYPQYGGRGITICDRWRDSFENFYTDMGKCPAPGYSIDRINVNGNYEPGNCRWADFVSQMRNKKNTIRVSYQGKLLTIGELSELSGIKYGSIIEAYRRGRSMDDYIPQAKERLLKKGVVGK